MFRTMLRTLMFFALIGGLISLTPTFAIADDAPSARGAKKKKKKKRKKKKGKGKRKKEYEL